MKRSILLLFLARLAAGAAVFPSDAGRPPVAETHALLEAVCPGTSYERGKETGCPVCPEGKKEDWSLGAVYYGHFVSAGSDDALLAVAGCEAHVNDFGDTILLTRQAGQWKKLSYHPGIITETCHKLKSKTGRELLVCEGGHTSQGVTELSI